ncbi:hypothetical protein [Microvirga puerhi]|uniref:Chromosome partitioning protein ParA n=1 Tax=Microvirga puerhi TaxID=2876078 RepID=A0ABS7VN06_9HYPH|nr:hypothetical protein [Microvirga puerhi]MBZ6076525.1 hypothetical protein [Microvirga puerhi]
MIFALGFLAATLIALLIIPAINSRAERLARRRVEALFPMSIEELSAEKDHLRAEFAILQRKLERKAEEAQAVKHQSMEELGRRAVRIQELEETLAARDGIITSRETELKATQEKQTSTEEELSKTRTSLSSARETLAALENAHRATLDELSNLRRELDARQAELTRTKAALQRAEEKTAERNAAYDDADARLTAALSELDVKRITISDLETRLMTQTARGNDFERALNERHSELSGERKRLAELATNLTAEQERGLILEQHIRELEAERDEKLAEIEALTVASADALKAQEAPNSEIALQNEELRRKIEELADQIVKNGKSQPAKANRRRRTG